MNELEDIKSYLDCAVDNIHSFIAELSDDVTHETVDARNMLEWQLHSIAEALVGLSALLEAAKQTKKMIDNLNRDYYKLLEKTK